MKRMVAGFIDYSIIIVFTSIITYFYGKPSPKEDVLYEVSGLPALAIIGVWLFLTVGMELIYERTLGNLTMNLRAIPRQNFRKNLSLGQSLGRHIFDLIDIMFLGIIGILFIKFTDAHQRFGDLVGGTIVIDESDPEQGIKKK